MKFNEIKRVFVPKENVIKKGRNYSPYGFSKCAATLNECEKSIISYVKKYYEAIE